MQYQWPQWLRKFINHYPMLFRHCSLGIYATRIYTYTSKIGTFLSIVRSKSVVSLELDLSTPRVLFFKPHILLLISPYTNRNTFKIKLEQRYTFGRPHVWNKGQKKFWLDLIRLGDLSPFSPDVFCMTIRIRKVFPQTSSNLPYVLFLRSR